jgi:hypothetical protein
MSVSNKEQLRGSLDEVYKAIEHCAKIKIEEINKSYPYIDLNREEHAILKKLIETETGHTALEKLLVDYGKANLTATLTHVAVTMTKSLAD